MEPTALHILIVDDSPEDRLTLQRFLTLRPPGAYKITEASQGDRALAACQADPPDCVLLDYRLPDMDGLDVLTALRAWSDVPVVLLTGVGCEPLAVETLQRGAQDYLVKAMITPERLDLTIQHAVAAVRLTRERDQTLAMLTTVLDTLPVGILVLDADLRVRQVNPALTTILNLPATAIPGQTLAQLWPDLAEPLAASCAQVPHGAGFSDLELRVPAVADHAEHWLSFGGTPLGGTDGTTPLALITVQDITARHQAAQQATEALARLDALMSSVPIGIGYLDHELRYQLVNPTLVAINERPLEDHLGHTIHDLLPSLAARVEPIMRQVLTTGEAVHDCELHGQACPTDGMAHDWLISYFPVRAGTGSVIGVGVTVADVTVSKRTAAALHTTERKLGMLFDILPVGISILDATGGVVYTNPALERIVRLDRTGLLNGAYQTRRYLRPDGTPLPPEEFASTRVFRTQQPVQDVEIGIITELDEAIWTTVSAVPVDFPDWRMVVVTSDITARKRAEVALTAAYAQVEEHAARLDSLLTHAPIGIALLDSELRFQHINAYLAAINRIPPEAHLGRPLREVLPNLAAQIEPILYQVLTTGTPVLDLEITDNLSAAPEETQISRISYFPVHAHGVRLGLGAVVLDITAQRQAERALEYERQQLATILESLDEGVAAVRPDGTFVVINPAAYRQLLLDPAPLPRTLAELEEPRALRLYNQVGELISVDDRPFQRALRGERFHNLVLRMRMAGAAEDRWMLFSGAPITDADGAVVLAIVTGDDITQQKHAELALTAQTEALSKTNAELTRALRLKDEFLAMMSHELRTPLNAVLSIAEGLSEGVYGPISERQQRALEQVDKSGRQLLDILSDILDLARIGAGAERLALEPVDLNPLGQHALQLVAERARQKQIRLLRTVAQGVEGVRADARRLTQILVNLLDNAVKFTPAGGTVGLEIVGDSIQEQIAFTVWDTGIGIAAADLDRLFRPFTQVDGRLARSYEGIGLGLTLVQRLTELHGGSVQLESTPGKGSRFTVTLPWSAADNLRPTAPSAPTPSPTWTHSPRVLVVEDHEPTLSVYVAQLAHLGCTVATARTGTEALSQIRAQRPDIVLLDIQLPEMDGLTVLLHIRADAVLAGIPVIALTALAMPGDRERCLNAGANAYLAKPVSLRTLVTTMADILTIPGETP